MTDNNKLVWVCVSDNARKKYSTHSMYYLRIYGENLNCCMIPYFILNRIKFIKTT